MVADQNLREENHVTPTDSFRRTDNDSGRRRKRFRPDSGSIRRNTPGFRPADLSARLAGQAPQLPHHQILRRPNSPVPGLVSGPGRAPAG